MPPPMDDLETALSPLPLRQRVRHFLGEEWRHLSSLQSSDRPWHMPLAAALAIGLPLLAGAWFDRLDLGLVASWPRWGA